MMNLCPRKIFCRTPLLELKALAQASPLPVNTDTQPHSTARCEQLHEDSSCKFKNVPKTSSQGGMTYLILSSHKPDHFHFADPSMLVFSCIFLSTDLNLHSYTHQHFTLHMLQVSISALLFHSYFPA